MVTKLKTAGFYRHVTLISLLALVFGVFFKLFDFKKTNQSFFNSKKKPFSSVQSKQSQSLEKTISKAMSSSHLPEQLPQLVFMNSFLIPLSFSPQQKISNQQKHLAKLNIQLEMENYFDLPEIESKKMHFRDIITVILSNTTYEHISHKDKKHELQADIKKTLNDFLSKGKIRKVHFKDVVLL